MNRTFTKILSVALVAAGSSQVMAQIEDEEDEEIFELSPFEINADDDTGYRATSSLAGTRIRTDLKDIAASISVITAEFLEDIGAKDNQTLLQFTTNTEVGGIYGNFSGLSNNQGTGEEAALLAPSNNTRVRGLEAADNTRDYFQSNVPWDGYNVARVEVQRGPNSILFGVGSPSGIINTGLITPMFENQTKYSNSFNNNGSIRFNVDTNKVLIEDVLAFRLAAVRDDEKYQQKPAYELDERVFGTVVYKPKLFGDGASTTLRGNFEVGNIEANRPRMLPPLDNITPYFDPEGLNRETWDPFWVAEERANVDPAIYPGQVHKEIVQPWLSGSMGNAYVGNKIIMDIDNSTGAVTDLAVSRANAHGTLDKDGVPDNGMSSYGYSRANGINGYNAYTKAVEVMNPGSFPGAAKNFYKDRVLTDASIFDFYNNLIDGENKQEWADWNSYNISFAQTFFDNRLGFEVVYDKQDFTQGAENFFGWNTSIGVDINSHTSKLPTRYENDDTEFALRETVTEGDVNENAGRAYISGDASGNNQQSEISRDTLRFTAFGEVNGNDFFDDDSILAKVIGRHTFTGIASRNERNDFKTNWTSWGMPTEFATDRYATVGDGRNFGYTVYLTDDLRNRTSANGLNIARIGQKITVPEQATIRYFDPTWNNFDVDPGDLYIHPMKGTESTQSENPANYVGWTEDTFDVLLASNPDDKEQLYTVAERKTEVLDSEGITWQGYLFGGKVVPTYGWRKDTIETWGTAGQVDPISKIPNIDFENDKSMTVNGSTISEGETVTWGVVVHSPEFINDKLPGGTDFSLFYNDSSNFKPENRVGFDTQALPNQAGESEDYGIVVRTLNDRLMIKATYFDTKVTNANLPGGNELAGGLWFLHGMEAWGTALSLKNELYWLGEMPGMAWRSNVALIDENKWGAEGWENAPFSEEALNHPSTVAQRAAIADWYATMPPQAFFDAYGLPIDVAKAQSGDFADRRTMVDNGNWSPWNAIGGITSSTGGKVNGLSPSGTINQISRGLEFEMVAQLTPNWNMAVNASKTTAERADLGENFVNFIEATKKRLDGPAGDLRLWWGGDLTFRENYDAIIYQAYQFQLDANGSAAAEVRPWRFNIINNYSFDEGKFKGLNTGFAFRWQDDAILGYKLNDEKTKLDVNRPITGGAESHLDAWVGYEKALSDRVNWKIQLNLSGIGKDDRLIPISVNPDGTPAAQRIAGGMGWTLSNTFTF